MHGFFVNEIFVFTFSFVFIYRIMVRTLEQLMVTYLLLHVYVVALIAVTNRRKRLNFFLLYITLYIIRGSFSLKLHKAH